MGEHPILSFKNINPSGADSTCVLSIYMSGHIGYVGFVFDIRISSTRLYIRRVCMQMCGYMSGHIGYVGYIGGVIYVRPLPRATRRPSFCLISKYKFGFEIECDYKFKNWIKWLN